MEVSEELLKQINTGFKILVERLACLEIKDTSRISYLKCLIVNIEAGASLESLKDFIQKEIDKLTICQAHNLKE